MQLEPEEDNRDGYAIRQMTKKMLHRSEAQKFLIVFSDGEPAAFGYEQNGSSIQVRRLSKPEKEE